MAKISDFCLLKRVISFRKYLNTLDPNLTKVFFKWAVAHPGHFRSFLGLMKSCKKASETRDRLKKEGIKIPPFLILSITSMCNLACAGCYASAAGTVSKKEKKQLSRSKWKEIIKKSSEAGVFGFVIAGGEPFLTDNLSHICKDFSDRLFIILTNGTAIQEKEINTLKSCKNTCVLVSMEGTKEMTDQRRGDGVHEKAQKTIQALIKAGIPTGISATITKNNFRHWMDEKLIDSLIAKGIKIAALIEYIPVTQRGNDHRLMLTSEERKEFRDFVLRIRETKKIYLIHSPGDEEYFGGCVSAGKGFAHVTPTGDLTPCPVSNIATHNLLKSTIREAFSSKLFREIRESEHLLENEGTPCALFSHPKEVNEIAKRTGAYKSADG
ncbi:MAG: radical SAM protein [Candidatus Aenigmarchaeota archaeon]|nr:radical SAM protein [Candidatus Aenigmarchaeota archaeon]